MERRDGTNAESSRCVQNQGRQKSSSRCSPAWSWHVPQCGSVVGHDTRRIRIEYPSCGIDDYLPGIINYVVFERNRLIVIDGAAAGSESGENIPSFQGDPRDH